MPPTSTASPPLPERPRVLLEHPDFYLVSKPPLWLTHKVRGRFDVPDLLDYLKAELGEPELAPPHRLDRETSGAQLLSRDPESASRFFTLFYERRLSKTYLALVHGHPDWDAQLLDAPLGSVGLSQHNAVQIRQGVTPDGRTAATGFRVAGRRVHPQHGPLTLIEARPRSGRLHQIRAHLSHLGLPLVGDKIYGRDPDAFLALMEDRLSARQLQGLILPRQALHAWRVQFPWSGSVVSAEVPLSRDLAGLWNASAQIPGSPDPAPLP